MSRIFRLAVVAMVALVTVVATIAPAASQTAVTGHAAFTASDGGIVAGGSYVIVDSSGTIIRQGMIGDSERAIFFSTFLAGETYTITAGADGYQTATQTLTATSEGLRFNVVLDPLKITKKTITIGLSKNGPSAWYLTEAPEGSTWTLTNIKSGDVYSGTFSGAVPQTITLSDAIGSGTYLVQIDAGPVFLPYEDTVTIQGNTGAFYFPLEVNTAVVPLY